jgi:hypothetical protein
MSSVGDIDTKGGITGCKFDAAKLISAFQSDNNAHVVKQI